MTARDKANRETDSFKLYDQISGPRSEFAVSIDEAKIFHHPGSQEAEIFYGKRGEDAPQECIVGDSHQFPQKFTIFRVPLETKVNASLYVEKVLKRIVEEEPPKMYSGDAQSVPSARAVPEKKWSENWPTEARSSWVHIFGEDQCLDERGEIFVHVLVNVGA